MNGERRSPFLSTPSGEPNSRGWVSSRGRRVVGVELWASRRSPPAGSRAAEGGCRVVGVNDSLRSPFLSTPSARLAALAVHPHRLFPPSVSLHAKNIRSAYYNPTSFSLTSHSLAALASSLTSSDTWFSKLPSFSDQDQ